MVRENDVNWDWHTVLLIMGGIACIEVYRLFRFINQQDAEIEMLRGQIGAVYDELLHRIDDMERKLSKAISRSDAPRQEAWTSWEHYQERKLHAMRHRLLDCLNKIRAVKSS